MEIADPVKPEFLANLFGESSSHKRKRNELKKALINKKSMLINTFSLPPDAEELLSFVHLAFNCWQSAVEEIVSAAWKGKVTLASNRLRTLINTNAADHIADEFLYLSEEISKAMEASEKKKRGFFG